MPNKISLKAARVNAGLTLKEASKLIGIDESTLVRWEKNPETVRPKYHSTISDVYHFSTDFIFFSN